MKVIFNISIQYIYIFIYLVDAHVVQGHIVGSENLVVDVHRRGERARRDRSDGERHRQGGHSDQVGGRERGGARIFSRTVGDGSEKGPASGHRRGDLCGVEKDRAEGTHVARGVAVRRVRALPNLPRQVVPKARNSAIVAPDDTCVRRADGHGSDADVGAAEPDELLEGEAWAEIPGHGVARVRPSLAVKSVPETDHLATLKDHYGTFQCNPNLKSQTLKKKIIISRNMYDHVDFHIISYRRCARRLSPGPGSYRSRLKS